MALKVTGVLLSCEAEKFSYTNKKTQKREDASRVTMVLQGDFGIIVGNIVSFNNKTDVSGFKVGGKVCLEVEEFKINDGIQTAKFRG